MPIYTKTGDTGETSLFGGKRLLKSDPQIQAYGAVDELTSVLGMIAVKMEQKEDKQTIYRIQTDLYRIMGIFAGAPDSSAKKSNNGSVLKKSIKLMEKSIDTMEKDLPKLTRFIIPGGNEISAWFHIARATCRRAERSLVGELSEEGKAQETNISIRYVNRLSDLLFTYARWYNRAREIII